MKKIKLVLLSFLLLLSVVGCKGNVGSDSFDEWSKTLPAILLGNDDYVLYSLFEDPANAGIDMAVEGLTLTTKEEYADSLKEYKGILKQLREYDYDDLNEDQKITYDVLEQNLTAMLNMKDYFYLNTNYFDINNGIQSSLALNLYFMDIVSEEALDAILRVMESTKEMFPKYVAFEVERQKAGYGMSETYRKEVLSQLSTFNKMDHTYLLEGLSDKINNASFLEDDKKNQYMHRLEKAYKDCFIPAYKQVEIDLSKIAILVKDPDASLADYEDGKEYYRQLIYETTGFATVDEFDLFLNEQENNITKRMIALINEYPELYSVLEAESMPEAVYTDFTNVEDTMAFLEEKVNTEELFPSIKNVSYQMDIVPEALQEIYKAAAAYYIGPFDNKDAKEQMILNGEFHQSDYTTLAHEGFPGHMYQYRYFKSTDHNLLRDILANSGYSEGWAVYASKEMNAYAEDEALCEFMSLNEDLIYIMIMRMDLMIHYDNEDRDSIYDYLNSNFMSLSEEDMSETYEQVLLDPGIFFPYYGYYLRLIELKEEMKEEWGRNYSDYKFHKAILDLGPLSYPLLELYLEEFY